MPYCECGSYAIISHCHGRDGSDEHLCDVCYWRTRAERLRAERDAMAKDAGRLDWLDAQWRDPIHLEISVRSFLGGGYVREYALFTSKGEVRAADVRSTIDAALAHRVGEQAKEG